MNAKNTTSPSVNLARLSTTPTSPTILPAGTRIIRGVPGNSNAATASAGAAVGSITTIDPVRVLRQYQWVLLSSVILGLIAGILLHFLWLYTWPTYRSVSVFQVHRPVTDPKQVGSAPGQADDQIERQLHTQAAQLIQPGILRDAINDTDVQNTKWIEQFRNDEGELNFTDALEDFQEHIASVLTPDSYYINLIVTGRNPDDVLRLNQAVVDVYRAQIESQKMSERSSQQLEFTSLRDKLVSQLQAVEKKIDDYLGQYNISPSALLDPVVQKGNLLLQSLYEQNQMLANAQSTVQYLEERLQDPNHTFTSEELAMAESDPKVYSMQNNLLQLQTTLRAKRISLGPKHYFVRDLENQVRAAEAELEVEIARVTEQYLNVQYETAVKSVESLEQSVDLLNQELVDNQLRLSDLSKHQGRIDSMVQEKQNLQVRINELDNSLDELNLFASSEKTNPATLQAEAYEDKTPALPKLPLSIALGVIVIVGLTTTIVFLREMMDKRVKGPSDISILPNGKILGVIPHLSDDPSNPRQIENLSELSSRGVIAESFRQMRNHLLQAMDKAGHKTLLVVGGMPGAGTTSIISNLATSIARTDRSVLVIDANFRRSKIAGLYGIAEAPGLGDVLCGAEKLENSIQQTNIPGIHVLSAGTSKYRIYERLGTEIMASILAQLSSEYGVILIDSPAAVAAGDSQVLLDHVDASVLVVRALQEERGLVTRLIHQLRTGKAEHLGIILNAARISAGGYFKRNFKHMATYEGHEIVSND